MILDQFRCAAFTHKQGVGLEALNGFTDVALHKLRCVAAQVQRLKCGVRHGGAFPPPFNHGEEKIRVGISLRSMKDVVHAFHGCGNAHRPNMGRAFIGPER